MLPFKLLEDFDIFESRFLVLAFCLSYAIGFVLEAEPYITVDSDLMCFDRSEDFEAFTFSFFLLAL